MPFYLYQIAYSSEAIKAMVAKPQNRRAAAEKMISAAGGKLHHMFFSFGPYDIVALIEAPDEKAMIAGALAVGAAGTTSKAMTTPLVSMEDGAEAMRMAGKALAAYASPMA